MSDISASIQVLQSTLPKLTMSEFIAMQNPVPRFEFNDHDKWFYSITEHDGFDGGKTLEGNLICVTASVPIEAEDLAQQGLLESIEYFKSHLAIGEIETEERPIH